MAVGAQTFPFNGSAQVSPEPAWFREIVCRHTVSHCIQRWPTGLTAIVLAGSLARDEATFVNDGRHWQALSDAEFLLIFKKGAQLPSVNAIYEIQAQIAESLMADAIACPVSLEPAHSEYLETMRPHIFGYELRTRGRVVWGNPAALQSIPDFRPNDIPLEDAWQLLSNRLVEQVELAANLEPGAATFPTALGYHAIKLYLDMAASFLLFVGAYEPTYRQRAEALDTLSTRSAGIPDLPFEIRHFAEKVCQATDWKLHGMAGAETGWPFWKSAVSHAWLLWRWELALLTNSEPWESDSNLRKKWAARQPLGSRLRGWAFAVRHCGSAGIRNWPRWFLLALHGSPRDWVYSQASDLCFRLPWFLGQGCKQHSRSADWKSTLNVLPLASPDSAPRSGCHWQRVARQIARNYHEFLEKTCA